jgi:AcrR family transcriptional regulator
MTSEASKPKRRNPKQARSRATFDAILEAAAQILERCGPAGFNTNAIAERAGVSIGTLYQYFPDKAAILLAAAGREAANAEPRAEPRPMVLLRALLALFDASELGGFAGAAPATSLAASRKPRRRRGSVVIRLAWSAPAWWLQPFMTQAVLPIRPRRR